MEHVADIFADGWRYPVYQDGNTYAIDLGGAIGLSDFWEFPSIKDAIDCFYPQIVGEDS